MGDAKWKVSNRKGLQTLRIDNATNLKPDLSHSIGVVGFNKHQGSLYIYLDAHENEHVVQIGDLRHLSLPYLHDSSWEVWKLKREKGAFSFLTKGWGKLKMHWVLPHPGRYKITTIPQAGNPEIRSVSSEENSLLVELDLPSNKLIKIKCTPEAIHE